MPTACAAGATRRRAWPVCARGDRVDDRGAVRARPAGGARLEVLIADAAKVKGLAPLACKTDKIDARVLAVLSQRDLVPEIWLPDPSIRRERARFRLRLVKHRSMLKHRVHATLITFGHPCPVTDLFGVAGRQLLGRLDVPQPWRATVDASLRLMDDLEAQIQTINKQLRALGPDHRYMPLLMTVPRIGWALSYTIAAEIGDIARFASPKKLCGYTGLCPRVNQSGDRDRRGPLTKQGPKYLRWAMLEATMHALRHPAYRERYQRNKAPAGPPAWRQGRPDRRRPKAHRSDLAHAHQQPALRSRPGRLHFSSGRLTALMDLSPRSRPPMSPGPPAEEAIER
jgi:transposase